MIQFLLFFFNACMFLFFAGLGACAIYLLWRFICFLITAAKKFYLHRNIEKVLYVETESRFQTFVKRTAHTGYSQSSFGTYYDHFQYVDVPTGYARKVRVFLTTGKSLRLTLKENSPLYKKITQPQ